MDPLRYKIVDWHQLTDCLSNSSEDFKIAVSDIFDGDTLSGTLIQVRHVRYGVVFSTLVNPFGLLVVPEGDKVCFSLPVEDILRELHKFGFFVKFSKKQSLDEHQLKFLKSLRDLHYDKIRFISVKTKDEQHPLSRHLVAFNYKKVPSWINNGHTATESEFISACVYGGAVDLTDVGNTSSYDWTWLDYVAGVKDLLNENQSIE